MAIKGNRGEWSEIYTFFRLLGEGRMWAGDADMNKTGIYYPIISIIREESERLGYRTQEGCGEVVIENSTGNELVRIPMRRFLSVSAALLEEIRSAESGAFASPVAEALMGDARCEKLKAPTGDKADIHIIIHDLRTGQRPELGFSIKSQLGSPATLLNASAATNFLYRVVGPALSDTDIASVNAVKGHLDRMEALRGGECRLEFADIENPTFRNNLLFLDGCMPIFAALCLLENSWSGAVTVRQAVESVAAQNPFAYTGGNRAAFYEHKMKALLLDTALDMSPATEWDGRYDANGGYIVVRSDGEIVCYHFYKRNDIEDYLYQNTVFERSSRSRHKWGTLFRGADGEVYIRLNLQIRFKK